MTAPLTYPIRRYVNDYQGNVRQVTDANGKVEQDNHYYPYGMLMGESSDIMAAARGNSSANSNPYLFASKEYLTTAGANLLDFTARTYDPSIPLFHTQDPMAADYTPFLPYLYCGGDPINRIDPTGCSTWVTAQSDGRYKVVGGDLEDDDLGIYTVELQDGKYEKTGIIGVTPVITSFYNSDANDGKGAWAIGSFIDPNDDSGIDFIAKMTGENTPGLIPYAFNARNGHPYDFKTTNGTPNAIEKIDIYRGMPMGTASNGTPIYTSARDIGNMMAGYVAGAHGMFWAEMRTFFDSYQSLQTSLKNKTLKFESEGISSQNAQMYGMVWGRRDTSMLNKSIDKADQIISANMAMRLLLWFIIK